MMGTIPIAREIARTRSSVCRCMPSALLQHVRGPGFAKLTDVSEWRTHRRWRYANHCLDSSACPAELSNDLFICQGCEGLIEKCHQGTAKTRRTETCVMGPGVYADLMASHVFLNQHHRTFNDARANNEEGRQDFFRVKVIEEFPGQKRSITIRRNAKHEKKKTD